MGIWKLAIQLARLTPAVTWNSPVSMHISMHTVGHVTACMGVVIVKLSMPATKNAHGHSVHDAISWRFHCMFGSADRISQQHTTNPACRGASQPVPGANSSHNVQAMLFVMQQPSNSCSCTEVSRQL